MNRRPRFRVIAAGPLSATKPGRCRYYGLRSPGAALRVFCADGDRSELRTTPFASSSSSLTKRRRGRTNPFAIFRMEALSIAWPARHAAGAATSG